MNMDKKLFESAKKYIPGGVNSPVRSFKSIGGNPVFVKKGSGAHILSESGRDFIDYCMSWGALLTGHAHPRIIDQLKTALDSGTSFGTATRKEVEMAQLIVEAVPSVQRVRLTSSGTEAVMSAIRTARGFTGRDKIIKFQGAYHGHADHLLGEAGSGAATFGLPDSAGVPADFVRHTIVLPFNDSKSLRAAVQEHRDDLAAIIVEPVMANCGVIPPEDGFLEELREVSRDCGAVLIFDEVITGFRISQSGAQGYFRVVPDMTCLGKIIGGGMPVGAFGGKEEIMQTLAPKGDVYQAGTLSGNPISVNAGVAVLKLLKELAPWQSLARTTESLCQDMERSARNCGIEVKINRIGSMFNLFFCSADITDYAGAAKQDKEQFTQFYHAMLDEGIYLSPSPFETNFLSTAHTDSDIAHTAEAARRAFAKIK